MPIVLSRDEVERIAALARLALTDEEKELFGRQLGEILSYAEEVRRIDTSGVPPTTHVLARHTGLREDEPQPSLERDAALANAPDPAPDAGLFKVPRVFG